MSPPPDRPSGLLIASTCVLYAVLMAFSVVGRNLDAGRESFIIVATHMAVIALLPLTAIGVLSLWKRFRSQRSRFRIALTVGLVWLASTTLAGLDQIGERAQERVATEEIRKVANTLSVMVSGAEDESGQLPAIDPTPKATGFYGEMERAIKTVAGARLAQHKAYLQELKDIGMPRLLDAHRLAHDVGLIESRMILEQAERLVPEYRRQSLQVLNDMPTLIRSLAIGEPDKQKMLRHLDMSLSQRNESLEQVWRLESRILQEFGQMITLLDDNRQYWYADHDELMFERDADLSRFRQHQTAIGKMASEQEQLGKRQLSNFFSALR